MAMERPSRRKLYSEEKREAYPLEQTKTTSWCRCCAGCAGAGSCTAFCGRKLAGKAQPKAGAPDGAAAGDRRDHGSGRCDLYVVSRNDSVLNFSDLHQSTRCKKLQRVFYCNLSKKVQSGAPSGDENSSGPPPVRRAKTPQWGVFRARESPRWCTKKSRNRCCGFFAAPFPSGRTHTSRERSCSSRGDWSLKMVAGL